jgi:hypothetical protein
MVGKQIAVPMCSKKKSINVESMNKIKVIIEVGKRRTIACAIDWPGWCRSGRDENLALDALIHYGPRYAKVLSHAPLGAHLAKIKFLAPADGSNLSVIERFEGNATTDFGAPTIFLDTDSAQISQEEFERFETILRASWLTFDAAMQRAVGRKLQKGPRGGGRNLEKIMQHVLDADQAYLSRLAWKTTRENEQDLVYQLSQTRQAILSALRIAQNGELPEHGPRGGVIWSPRYFVRRVTWHVLDHAWEIDDRIV